MYVISKDSDLLAYSSIQNLICIEKCGYTIFRKNDAVEALNLNSRNEIVLLCCLLKSDYSKGIKGIGPAQAHLHSHNLFNNDEDIDETV